MASIQFIEVVLEENMPTPIALKIIRKILFKYNLPPKIRICNWNNTWVSIDLLNLLQNTYHVMPIDMPQDIPYVCKPYRAIRVKLSFKNIEQLNKIHDIVKKLSDQFLVLAIKPNSMRQFMCRNCDNLKNIIVDNINFPLKCRNCRTFNIAGA